MNYYTILQLIVVTTSYIFFSLCTSDKGKIAQLLIANNNDDIWYHLIYKVYNPKQFLEKSRLVTTEDNP